MSVDFEFSPEQIALRDMARDLLEKEWPPARLREAWNGAERDGRVWKMLAEVGILGVAVPVASGGSGGSALDLALVLEEAGRAALPDPVVETALVGGVALAAFGGGRLRDEWLPRIAAGTAVIAVAMDASPFVADADVADLVLVQRGSEVHLATKFSARPARSMDLARRIFTVDAALSAETLLTADPAAAARVGALAALGTACVLNGVCARLVEMTRAYVTARKQFDRPVGSFQAVAHKVADMHVSVESARAAAWYAAYADATSSPDAILAASVAKAQAGEASRLVNREALQCHGGIGFTWEHELHLWLKRGIALEQANGSAREHRALVAATLFDEDA